MNWHLGFDSSTQSISAVIIDVDSGKLVADLGVNFGEFSAFNCPNGFLPQSDDLVKHADPLVWLAGLEELLRRLKAEGINLANVNSISGSGQQHGTVYLNQKFLTPAKWDFSVGLVEMIRPMLSRATSPIWMDSSTSAECAEITAAAGGRPYVQTTTGSPAIERFSGPQIRKFFKQDPPAYENTAVIHIEKANQEISGIYAAINQLFCLHAWSGMEYINREQDLGIEGLRKAKESYAPHHLVNKYTLVPKGIK